jgi:hypothetical protein
MSKINNKSWEPGLSRGDQYLVRCGTFENVNRWLKLHAASEDRPQRGNISHWEEATVTLSFSLLKLYKACDIAGREVKVRHMQSDIVNTAKVIMHTAVSEFWQVLQK